MYTTVRMHYAHAPHKKLVCVFVCACVLEAYKTLVCTYCTALAIHVMVVECVKGSARCKEDGAIGRLGSGIR